MNSDNDKVYLNLQRVPLKSEREEKKNKRNKIIINIIVFVILISVGFVGGLLFYRNIHPSSKFDTVNAFGEIKAILKNQWLYADDYEDLNTELEDKAFYGMTSFVEDPYTTYMSKSELEAFASTINMDFVGIGVVYTLQGDYPIIERVIINSPAQKAGLLTGDIITHIDGESVSGLGLSEIKEKAIGLEGSLVTITILRNNESMDVDVIRGAVDNSVYCYVNDDYVVLDIYSFGESSARDCMSYLDQYLDYHKIIINLRDNTGGYQTAVSELTGLFIGNNKVYLKQSDASGELIERKTFCTKTYTNFDKIVILVNEDTASAAEVFAICLKEQLDNVTLVGATTFGKGVIQSTHYLVNGGSLKYTSYNWYSPSGVSINGVGITPDIEVKQADVYYETYSELKNDEVLAIDVVDNRVKTAQKCLKFLNYYNGRTDGYFDKEFEKAIYSFRVDNNIDEGYVLEANTYDSIISKTISALSDSENDYQMLKAIEIINE